MGKKESQSNEFEKMFKSSCKRPAAKRVSRRCYSDYQTKSFEKQINKSTKMKTYIADKATIEKIKQQIAQRENFNYLIRIAPKEEKMPYQQGFAINKDIAKPDLTNRTAA